MRDPYTEMGGEERSFPRTRWSVIADAGDPDSQTYQRSLEDLARSYWRPVYAHFRRKWRVSNDEAKDMTQDFFLSLSEKKWLGRLSTEKGRFRSYIMAALDNFVRMRRRGEMALKRGGGRAPLSLETLEGFEPSDGKDLEQAFLRDWGKTILEDVLEEIEAECEGEKGRKVYEAFVAREIDSGPEEDTSYDALAARLGLTHNDLRNGFYRLRRRIRDRVHARVLETVSSEEEARLEMQQVLEALTG